MINNYQLGRGRSWQPCGEETAKKNHQTTTKKKKYFSWAPGEENELGPLGYVVARLSELNTEVAIAGLIIRKSGNALLKTTSSLLAEGDLLRTTEGEGEWINLYIVRT